MPSAASASAAPRCVRETDTFWWPSPGTSLKTGFVPWNRLSLAKHSATATAALHNLSVSLLRALVAVHAEWLGYLQVAKFHVTYGHCIIRFGWLYMM